MNLPLLFLCDRRWGGTFCSGPISAGNMNERGKDSTAAGLGMVGRRLAGEGGGGLVSLL